LVAAFFCININMQLFKKFFENKYNGPQVGVNHRHRRAIPKASSNGYSRNSEKIIPDYVKIDPSKNSKIESLKDRHGMRVCDRKDLEYMRTEYNVIPIKGEIKKLGSTGIQLYYDDKTKNFIIKR